MYEYTPIIYTSLLFDYTKADPGNRAGLDRSHTGVESPCLRFKFSVWYSTLKRESVTPVFRGSFKANETEPFQNVQGNEKEKGSRSCLPHGLT